MYKKGIALLLALGLLASCGPGEESSETSESEDDSSSQTSSVSEEPSEEPGSSEAPEGDTIDHYKLGVDITNEDIGDWVSFCVAGSWDADSAGNWTASLTDNPQLEYDDVLGYYTVDIGTVTVGTTYQWQVVAYSSATTNFWSYQSGGLNNNFSTTVVSADDYLTPTTCTFGSLPSNPDTTVYLDNYKIGVVIDYEGTIGDWVHFAITGSFENWASSLENSPELVYDAELGYYVATIDRVAVGDPISWKAVAYSSATTNFWQYEGTYNGELKDSEGNISVTPATDNDYETTYTISFTSLPGDPDSAVEIENYTLYFDVTNEIEEGISLYFTGGMTNYWPGSVDTAEKLILDEETGYYSVNVGSVTVGETYEYKLVAVADGSEENFWTYAADNGNGGNLSFVASEDNSEVISVTFASLPSVSNGGDDAPVTSELAAGTYTLTINKSNTLDEMGDSAISDDLLISYELTDDEGNTDNVDVTWSSGCYCFTNYNEIAFGANSTADIVVPSYSKVTYVEIDFYRYTNVEVYDGDSTEAVTAETLTATSNYYSAVRGYTLSGDNSYVHLYNSYSSGYTAVYSITLTIVVDGNDDSGNTGGEETSGIVTYIPSVETVSSTALSDDEVLEILQNGVSEGTDIIESVSDATYCYSGYSSGDDSWPYLRSGKSNTDGGFTLNTTASVYKVDVSVAGWKNSDALSVGGDDAWTPGYAYTDENAVQEHTFEFDATTSVTFTSDDRVFYYSITLYYGSSDNGTDNGSDDTPVATTYSQDLTNVAVYYSDWSFESATFDETTNQWSIEVTLTEDQEFGIYVIGDSWQKIGGWYISSIDSTNFDANGYGDFAKVLTAGTYLITVNDNYPVDSDETSLFEAANLGGSGWVNDTIFASITITAVE